MKFLTDIRVLNRKIVWLSPLVRDKFLEFAEGKEMSIEIREKVSLPEKTRMNKYYHGPILDALHQGLKERGYLLPKGALKMYFEERFACEEIVKIPVDGGETELRSITKSVSDMTKDELRDFIEMCIQHLWEEFNIEAPDAAGYLAKKSTGRGWRSA